MSVQYPPSGPAGPQGSGAGTARAGGISGFAVASLVFSLLWLCGVGSVFAIVFGVLALPRIKRRGQSGRGLAVAGLVLGVLGLLAAIGLGLLGGVVDRTHKTRNAEILLQAGGADGVTSADVTYSFGDSTGNAADARLPWSKRERRDLGGLDIVRVVTRNGTASGTVNCRITVNGKVVQSATVTGGHTSASCTYNPVASH
ncbi:DUF4190 domain-containing protein [Actinomadura harenae]|uniref:DUF4190 domain-containing protein n=1 Tax=Actinomadura harenae TaxID=2483351 RepID=A0A3M2LR01_9ACTN|nr:DUF4190 domain-containing protein [Actinomadura harenae]RMI38515.1 DUF4190 domain-containing protein [Actinomadura harenae]